MNTIRVFLHDQLWQQEPEGFKRCIGEFLTIAKAHGIEPLLVLFGSCWEPDPKLVPQHPPIPGVHNSGWVQGPGLPGLRYWGSQRTLHVRSADLKTFAAQPRRLFAWSMATIDTIVQPNGKVGYCVVIKD
ncbi:hypothetical protein ACVWZA_004376 [Sphingomonas sp. UYAg733]